MSAEQSSAGGGVRAGILVTGTEVLTAQISDRNGPWISKRLGELGVEVAQILIVGDRPDDLDAALRSLAERGCDLIVTSGGLGPTADDLTAEVVARYAGVEMVLDEAMEERIAAILDNFARRLRFDPEALRVANRKQAMVPSGAETIDPAGTAPGLVVAVADGPTVVVLPGPPRELHAMWAAALATRGARAVLSRATPYRSQILRLLGVPESEIAQTLREIEAEHDLSALEVTTCLRRGELEVDVRHRAGADEARETLVAGIAERHGRFLFSSDGSTIDEQVAALLADGHRIALAESCTAGSLAARIGEPPGASRYLAGGVVAYSNEAKVGAARRARGSDRSPRRGLARGRRGDGGRGARALRRRSRGRDHGDRRARTGAPRRSRSATSASAFAAATGRRSRATR